MSCAECACYFVWCGSTLPVDPVRGVLLREVRTVLLTHMLSLRNSLITSHLLLNKIRNPWFYLCENRGIDISNHRLMHVVLIHHGDNSTVINPNNEGKFTGNNQSIPAPLAGQPVHRAFDPF